MKQAVMFGAGNIGRGFIGALLARSGWHVTFADVSEPLIREINQRGRYTVHILDQECGDFEVENVSAVSSAGEEIAQVVAGCGLITTAVGPTVAPVIAKPIAAGIRARIAAGNTDPMNVVSCENGIRTTTRLKGFVLENLNEEEAAFLEAHVGFADCAVDRICPKAFFDSPLDTAVERYMEWDVETANWKGERPEVEGMTFVDDLPAYLERKLFTLNSTHAVCAYLGYLKGYKTILRSVEDPSICAIVRGAMAENGACLVRRFGFDREAHQAYMERIFARFHNPYLRDSVARVGREPIRKLAPADRLIKPLTAGSELGLPVDNMLFGAAGALRYDCLEDKQSVEMLEKINKEGASAVLTACSGLEPGTALHSRILDIYRALSVAER